jgi:hypothetical protein
VDEQEVPAKAPELAPSTDKQDEVVLDAAVTPPSVETQAGEPDGETAQIDVPDKTERLVDEADARHVTDEERQAWDDKCKQEAEEEKARAAKTAQVAKEAEEAAAARKAAKKARRAAWKKRAADKKAAADKKGTKDPTAGSNPGKEDDESTTVLPHARNAQLGKQVQGRVSYLVLLAAIVCLAGPVVCTDEAETLSPFPADEAESMLQLPHWGCGSALGLRSESKHECPIASEAMERQQVYLPCRICTYLSWSCHMQSCDEMGKALDVCQKQFDATFCQVALIQSRLRC